MLIETKQSKMHANKVFELRSGVSGSGKDVLVIQTIVNNVCTNTETFGNIKEGQNWFAKVCN